MRKDPTLSRIRQARHKISERVGHDPERLVQYYIELQERHRDRLITVEEEAAPRKAA